MGMILGGVIIRVNSKEIKSTGGATLNPGGYQRTSHVGCSRVWGKSRKYVPPTIECVIAADQDVDVLEINAIENATISWEGDNGVDYLMSDCAPKEPATLREESGDIAVTFEGASVKRA